MRARRLGRSKEHKRRVLPRELLRPISLNPRRKRRERVLPRHNDRVAAQKLPSRRPAIEQREHQAKPKRASPAGGFGCLLPLPKAVTRCHRVSPQYATSRSQHDSAAPTNPTQEAISVPRATSGLTGTVTSAATFLDRTRTSSA